MEILQTFVKRAEIDGDGEMLSKKESFYKFLERVTKSANELAKEYTILNISYPSEDRAVITYAEHASDNCFVSKEDVINIIQARLHASPDGSREQSELNAVLLRVIALPILQTNVD